MSANQLERGQNATALWQTGATGVNVRKRRRCLSSLESASCVERIEAAKYVWVFSCQRIHSNTIATTKAGYSCNTPKPRSSTISSMTHPVCSFTSPADSLTVEGVPRTAQGIQAYLVSVLELNHCDRIISRLIRVGKKNLKPLLTPPSSPVSLFPWLSE